VAKASATSRFAPRAEFASLHRPEEATKPQQSDTERGLGGHAIGMILKDPTLRPGDVVVFPDGPKVFTGGSGRHTRADFEDIHRSTAVPKEVRKAVLALTNPPASLAREARRRVPAKGPATVADGPVQASADDAIRVVYPSGLRAR